MSFHSVLMPDLGEGVLEGEIQKLLVRVGDQVQEDQALLEVMTDKASVEIPSPSAGKIKELKIKVGENCPIGKTLIVLETFDNKKTSEKKENSSKVKKEIFIEKKESSPKVKEEISDKKDESFQESNSLDQTSFLAVPAVRKKAKELGIDLKNVQGTGLSHRITMKDLEKLIPSSPSSPASQEGISIPINENQKRIPLKGVRKKIAAQMQLSKATIPHFTLMDQAHVESLYKLKNQSQKLYPDVKITYLPFIMKILHHCLIEFPELNASIDSKNQEIVYKTNFNFGIATDTPRGLLVPVIKNIDQKNIIQICKEIVELSGKARNSKIDLADMQDATITITNMGSIAGRWATPIINPPEVCILGMYRMFENPVWKNESFHPVRTMNFSLTCDHRLIDGALAARFMSRFVENIENPSLILIEG